MPWRVPLLAVVPMAFWAFPGLAVEFVVLALTTQDTFALIQQVGIAVGSAAAGIGGAATWYLKAYEGSAKQQVDLNTRQIGGLQKENAELTRANADLKAKLEDRDRVIESMLRSIASRDETIASRDEAIEEQSRLTHRLGEDVAGLAKAFLIAKGDLKEATTP